MEKYTPMMMQYLKIKEKYPDTLILFRLGDFYELFFDDAKIASRELSLALTGKSAGVEEKVPMCGVPYHAISSYLEKLISKGYKVGIVEQLEDPKLAKGIVSRDVVQIITPGAFIDNKSKDNNFIASLAIDDRAFSLGYIDVSTGEVYCENLPRDIKQLIQSLLSLEVKEVVLPTTFNASIIQDIKNNNILVSYENNLNSSLEFEDILMDVRHLKMRESLIRLINYLTETQKRSLTYLKKAVVVRKDQYLNIDNSSLANLELVKTIRGDSKYGTLLWLLDETNTNMGSRLLKQFILKPLASKDEILKRQSVVDALMDKFLLREDLKNELKEFYDLDRLASKISFGSCNGRDLLQLKKSLSIVPQFIKTIKALDNLYLLSLPGLNEDFISLVNLLEKAISDDAPITIKDGEIFKKGYSPELDELITLSTDSKSFLQELEAKEKERLGIKTLRIGYNKVFGYYLEISKGATTSLPDDFNYERKQTTINSERYVSQELKDYENKVLNAWDKRKSLEYALFTKLREVVSTYVTKIQDLSSLVAFVDCMVSFAEVSLKNHYVKPVFNDERLIHLKESRHPVLEKVNTNYVSNSFEMNKDIDILMITGPNMGGKSTYMRQLALIVIMAQMGMYVPAEEASLMLFDSIFTRIGASDNLVSGESTFMVEMNETNFALTHANENSLLLFDEIGRGTATFDGMALAQSILEYVAQNIHSKTLFSTHYHQLTQLDNEIKSLKNIHVAVNDEDDNITFLYKVLDGPMNQSYGINVAKLASLPDEVISRAKEILAKLENEEIKIEPRKIVKKDERQDYLKEILSLDVYSLSPLEALNYLYNLQKKVRGE